MDTVWLSSSNIADHEGIDHGVCRMAVDKVIEYYQQGGFLPDQTATLLKQYILSGDANRAMVVQFRQYVREIETAHEHEQAVWTKLAEKWQNKPVEER